MRRPPALPAPDPRLDGGKIADGCDPLYRGYGHFRLHRGGGRASRLPPQPEGVRDLESGGDQFYGERKGSQPENPADSGEGRNPVPELRPGEILPGGGKGWRYLRGELSAWSGDRFGDSEALIFVGACGIAVRAVAPWVRGQVPGSGGGGRGRGRDGSSSPFSPVMWGEPTGWPACWPAPWARSR